MATLTLAQREHRNALTDIATIDRHITAVAEDLARHKRCGQCWRTRSDTMALDLLLMLRLRFMSRRDTTALDLPEPRRTRWYRVP
jgi:hypothetical protein